MSGAALWRARLKGELSALRGYAYLVAGSGGRLVLSLAYFVSVANGLSVSDFGLFATASATGIVLSRIAGLGFMSPLYRAATVKPRLIGAYTAGFLAALLVSLPLVAAAGALFYALVFARDMALAPFVAIVAAEVLFWRMLEVVVIVNNGLGRFGTGALIVVGGSAIRALAAVLFAAVSDRSLLAWSLAYLGANALAMLLAVALFYPRRRLRFAPRLYLARWQDSVAVAGAEILFYVQSELDKLLVLTIGGPAVAGLYAILMRLVDLTALPIRSFTTMIVQKLMRTPELLAAWRTRWSMEAGIAAVSVAGLACLGLVLHVAPTALGRNVAEAAPFVLAVLLVPAFRNLVEYHSELLYARGKTVVRALILGLLGLVKAGLLILLLRQAAGTSGWIVGLNALFFGLWLVSVSATYSAYDADWRLGRGRRPLRSVLQPDG